MQQVMCTVCDKTTNRSCPDATILRPNAITALTQCDLCCCTVFSLKSTLLAERHSKRGYYMFRQGLEVQERQCTYRCNTEARWRAHFYVENQ